MNSPHPQDAVGNGGPVRPGGALRRSTPNRAQQARVARQSVAGERAARSPRSSASARNAAPADSLPDLRQDRIRGSEVVDHAHRVASSFSSWLAPEPSPPPADGQLTVEQRLDRNRALQEAMDYFREVRGSLNNWPLGQ